MYGNKNCGPTRSTGAPQGTRFLVCGLTHIHPRVCPYFNLSILNFYSILISFSKNRRIGIFCSLDKLSNFSFTSSLVLGITIV